MSHRTLILGLAAATFIGGPGLVPPAFAADLDTDYGDAPPPPIAEQKVEFGSGWYIRGDIGATTGLAASAGNEPYGTSNLHLGTGLYANGPAYTNGVILGPGQTTPSLITAGSHQLMYDGTIGGGYQFNKWFRADVTFDFHQPSQSSYQGKGVPCIIGTAGVGTSPYTQENIVSNTCTPTLAASLKSYSTLVNGYIDLGTWSIVTPYIGAGVGLSFGHADTSASYVLNNQTSYNGYTFTDAISGATVKQDWDRQASAEYYNLAFALMGGVAIDVFDHTKLDIGYRYLHLGDVLGTNLNAQEVRAGIRYMIDN